MAPRPEKKPRRTNEEMMETNRLVHGIHNQMEGLRPDDPRRKALLIAAGVLVIDLEEDLADRGIHFGKKKTTKQRKAKKK